MTHAYRRSRHLALPGLAIVLLVAACGGGGPSASSAARPSVAPSAVPSTPPASASPSPSAATATPVATPTAIATTTPGPSQATACQPLPQSGALPSDRFTELRAETGATADRLTFVFGNPSLPGPASPPQGSLEVAQAPYTQAGSGARIAMTGDHVLALRFTGMSLSNDVGQPTYDGPRELTPAFEALQQAVLFDASEGVVGWYVGYDGTGCVTLGRTSDGITLTIDHG